MSGHEIPDLGGLKSAWQLWHGAEWLRAPRHSFSVRIRQVVSFAGDPARNDIDETKFELEWRDTWGAGHCAKAKAKPVIDWVGRGQTGAALDLEGSWWIGPQWTFALLAGGRLWGEGVPSTFEGRAEIRLVYRYRGVADPAVPSTDRAPMHDRKPFRCSWAGKAQVRPRQPLPLSPPAQERKQWPASKTRSLH